MGDRLVVAPRFRGPKSSANGGYTCGLLAALAGGEAEVTLRRPPPLERPLGVVRDDGRVELRDGDALVADAVPTRVELALPAPVAFDAAEAAALPCGDESSPFPECFVCGRARAPGDGLRIFVGPVSGRAVHAAAWIAPARAPELVWAALDCPGAYASGAAGRGEAVLGRFAARIDRTPEAGERCVVVAWPLGEEGRKLYAGTALFSQDGEPLARARAAWILPR